jgi:hypothetical protein
VFGWTPGIGDPTIYGWVTVVAYGVGALCCYWAATHSASRERRFWLLLTVIMAFLCINKQLDLQTLFTDAGRVEAKLHGWYDQRRKYQLLFIILLTVASTIAVLGLLRRMRRASTPVKGATIGLAVLLVFVLVRASSFNKVDWFIHLRLAGLRANHLMELGGIIVVTLFALAAARGKRGFLGR